MLVCLLVGLLSFLPFMTEIADAVQSAATTNNLLPLFEAARNSMTIFAVLYVLLAALFRYRKALVGWWGTPLTIVVLQWHRTLAQQVGVSGLRTGLGQHLHWHRSCRLLPS